MGAIHDQFKREMRSYRYYKDEIVRLQAMIDQINDDMTSVKSPSLDHPPIHQDHDAVMSFIIRKDTIQRRIDALVTITDHVDDCLNGLSKEEREVLTDIYIDKLPVENVSRNHYMSQRKTFRWINKAIEKAIQ